MSAWGNYPLSTISHDPIQKFHYIQLSLTYVSVITDKSVPKSTKKDNFFFTHNTHLGGHQADMICLCPI